MTERWVFDEGNRGKSHGEQWGLLHEASGFQVGVHVDVMIERDPFHDMAPLRGQGEQHTVAKEVARQVAKLPVLLESNATIPYLLEVEDSKGSRYVKGAEVVDDVLQQPIPYYQDRLWFRIVQTDVGYLVLQSCNMVDGKDVPPDERIYNAHYNLTPSASMFLYNATGVYFKPNKEELTP